MKKTITALLAVSVLCVAVKATKYEGGFMLGEPTGVSFKAWTAADRAIDFGFGWSFADETKPSLHADYLWHNFSIFDSSKPVYYGIGSRIKFHDEVMVGFRFPIGIQYFLAGQPFTLFAELAPIVNFTPEFDLRIHAAVGARYKFGGYQKRRVRTTRTVPAPRTTTKKTYVRPQAKKASYEPN